MVSEQEGLTEMVVLGLGDQAVLISRIGTGSTFRQRLNSNRQIGSLGFQVCWGWVGARGLKRQGLKSRDGSSETEESLPASAHLPLSACVLQRLPGKET